MSGFRCYRRVIERGLETNEGSHIAYSVAATGAFHLAESRQVSLEDVHLLHQSGESRLRGFTHLLINSFGLGERRDAWKHTPQAF